MGFYDDLMNYLHVSLLTYACFMILASVELLYWIIDWSWMLYDVKPCTLYECRIVSWFKNMIFMFNSWSLSWNLDMWLFFDDSLDLNLWLKNDMLVSWFWSCCYCYYYEPCSMMYERFGFVLVLVLVWWLYAHVMILWFIVKLYVWFMVYMLIWFKEWFLCCSLMIVEWLCVGKIWFLLRFKQ